MSQVSQTDCPRPPALTAPSTWYDDVAAPHSRVAGGGVDNGAYPAEAPSGNEHPPLERFFYNGHADKVHGTSQKTVFTLPRVETQTLFSRAVPFVSPPLGMLR